MLVNHILKIKISKDLKLIVILLTSQKLYEILSRAVINNQ
jgi:hypothetical protein